MWSRYDNNARLANSWVSKRLNNFPKVIKLLKEQLGESSWSLLFPNSSLESPCRLLAHHVFGNVFFIRQLGIWWELWPKKERTWVLSPLPVGCPLLSLMGQLIPWKLLLQTHGRSGLRQTVNHTSSLLRAPEHVTCSVTGIVILVLYCHVHYLPVCPHTPGVPQVHKCLIHFYMSGSCDRAWHLEGLQSLFTKWQKTESQSLGWQQRWFTENLTGSWWQNWI